MRTGKRRLWGAVVAVGVALSSSALVGLQPAAAAAGDAKISWSPCYRQSGFPFECGTTMPMSVSCW